MPGMLTLSFDDVFRLLARQPDLSVRVSACAAGAAGSEAVILTGSGRLGAVQWSGVRVSLPA